MTLVVTPLHSLSKRVIPVRVRGRLLAVLLACSATAAAATRQPAMAGSFYTANPDHLRRQVVALLAAEARPERPAVALVVPHAGYVYSGATAARSFNCLTDGNIQRVILLGPSHHRRFRGGALPARDLSAFATPLGEVALDREAIAVLRKRPEFQGPAAAHGPEHSLEVQLPFLQLVLPEARIVPVLVGLETDRELCRRMAEELLELIDAQTIVVASSDFTHHGARYGYEPFAGDTKLGDTLVELARTTSERLTQLDPTGFWYQVEVSGDTVCGRRPLAVLGELLEGGFAGSGRVIDVTTSGHVSGDWALSVSYVAAAFEGRWRSWRPLTEPKKAAELSEERGRALVELARATMRSHLVHGADLATWFADNVSGEDYNALAGAFVTLHNLGERARREGRMRACMGVIEAEQPLVDAVIRAAVTAIYDPRFPRVTADELADLEFEVSVLSPTHPVAGPAAIRVGEHGVVLSKGRSRAVFLPHVATEQRWDRDTMLDQLALKAGLPEDGWRSGARFEVFTAQVFSEGR
jgi:AmmeMemoRadiSam system protein B/AmmeMemoRadiSam system protein A